MSSGWPPEEDDRRWEPARHPSAVGAVHDSRDAERGYSGFAHYDAEGQYTEGQYTEEQYADGQYPEGTEAGWYGTAETSYPAVDYQPQPDNAGYGEVSYPDVYDLNGTGHDYGTPPVYGPPAGYVEHPSFPNLPAQPHYGAPVSADYEANGYQAGYEQAGYPQADHPQADPPHAGEADYGYADYGDSRYNDPNYGDPAYEDAQYAAAEQAQAPQE